MKKRVLSLAMALALVLSLAPAAFAAELPELTVTQETELPARDWQKTASFPDWKGYTDNTLALNSTVSFYGYHGQGRLFVEVAEETESFNLYVNGVKADVSGKSGVFSVDISAAAKDGVNTLQVSNILPLGLKNAVTIHIPYPEVLPANGETGGIHPLAAKLVNDLIASDVAFGFPSAQLAVVRNGRMVYENAWGRVNAYAPDGTPLTDSPAVTNDTLYDLASVTKMFSVNYAVQKLVTDGKLNIDTPVVEILGDEFATDTLDLVKAGKESAPSIEQQIAWKRSLTPRMILAHQGGFPAGPAYNVSDFNMVTNKRETPGCNQFYAVDREAALKAVFGTPLDYAPGSKTVYSDVDYMLLCFIVEKITGERLDEYMKKTFYEPLGLAHTTFLPLENGFSANDCAATELNGNTRDHHVNFDGIRTQTLQGQVHDEKAWYCMEGVSGHAGLFSNASDLACLASVMFTGGYGEHRFFSRTVMDLFTAPKAFDFGQWGLGWWRQGDDQRVWYFGTQAESDTFGHQGWTGTLVMIDPSRDLVIAYLTNKINSPIIDESNLNRFCGNAYTASTLGFVPQILSVGLDEGADISGQLMDLLADMAAESLKLIPDGADASHPSAKSAQSKIAVLKTWAKDTGKTEYAAFADGLLAKIPGARPAANEAVSRAWIARILFELSGTEKSGNTASFADVSKDDWYADAVTWMVESGIARGEGARFGASESVTREQLAVMLYNYAKCEGCDVSARGDLSVFPDGGSVSAWARDALAWAIGMKLINGAADGGSVILDP